MSRQLRTAFMALVLVASWLIGSLPAGAQDGAPALFKAAAAGKPSIASEDASHVTRSRYVNVNMDMLFDARGRRDAKSMPEIRLICSEIHPLPAW